MCDLSCALGTYWVSVGGVEKRVASTKKKKKQNKKTLLEVFALIFGVLKNLPLRPMEVF